MSTNPSDTDGTASGTKTGKQDSTEPGWYSVLLGPPFRLIGFFYRSYQSNRQRLASLTSRPRISSALRTVLVLTLFLWIAIWLFASDENRNRLTETAKQHFRTIGTMFEN